MGECGENWEKKRRIDPFLHYQRRNINLDEQKQENAFILNDSSKRSTKNVKKSPLSLGIPSFS